jgi:predicted secreted protein
MDGAEYKLLSCLTDCSFAVSSNKIPVTSRSTGKWASYDYTTLAWSGSASGVFFIQLVTGGLTPFELNTKQINQEKPTVQFIVYDRQGYGKQVTGSVMIDEMSFEGGAEDFAVFNLSFTGTGPLVITEYNSCQLIDSDSDGLVDSDGSVLVDGSCFELTTGEFDPADFSDADFLT